MTSQDAKVFTVQNPIFMEGLTEDDIATIDLYAEHHAGGLFVLYADLGDGVHIKAHDSWGPGAPEEPGDIVVQLYDPEEYDRTREVYFDRGHEALEFFLGAKASDLPLERSYSVGLPVLVTVTDEGEVRYEVDTGEARIAVEDDYPNAPQAVLDAIDADHDRRHGR